MITYEFDEKTKIFFVFLSGSVGFNDIKNYLNDFNSITYLPPDLCLLYDLRDAEIIMTTDQLKEISKIAENFTRKYNSIKSAFLVNKPLPTAYSVIFAKLEVANETYRQVFSTKGVALNWLLEDNS